MAGRKSNQLQFIDNSCPLCKGDLMVLPDRLQCIWGHCDFAIFPGKPGKGYKFAPCEGCGQVGWYKGFELLCKSCAEIFDEEMSLEVG